MMKKYIKLNPTAKESILKIAILKTMMYCGVLWGLYHPEHKGWAIKSEHDEYIFPFWLSSLQALQYAKVHWPHYVPRKITPEDFEASLLPTLMRLQVSPTLFNQKSLRFKLSTEHMRLFFFTPTETQLAVA